MKLYQFWCALLPIVLSWHTYSLLDRDAAALLALEQKWDRAHQQHLNLLVQHQGDDQLMYDTGVCAYKVEDYEHAITYFNRVTQSEKASDQLKHDAYYNCGNALAMLSELKKAADAYEQALLYDPDDQNAKDNLEIVKKMQDNNGDSGESDSGSGDQSEDQGDGDSDSDDQSSSENSSNDQQDSDQNNQNSSDDINSDESESDQEQQEQDSEADDADNEESKANSEDQPDDEQQQDTQPDQEPSEREHANDIDRDNQRNNAPDQSCSEDEQTEKQNEDASRQQAVDEAEQESASHDGQGVDGKDVQDDEQDNSFFCQQESDMPDWMAQLLEQQDQEDAQMNQEFALQQMQAGADREKAHCW